MTKVDQPKKKPNEFEVSFAYRVLNVAPAPADLFAVFHDSDRPGTVLIDRAHLVAACECQQVRMRIRTGEKKVIDTHHSIEAVIHDESGGFDVAAGAGNYKGSVLVPNATPEKVAAAIEQAFKLKWSGELP